ncbi:acetyltransferase [Deinococcus sp. Marseille-Q6407]|uniref:acetyltransferase n=1 Tax=Deinococcus sp. Marseille-Q6407 TaxID=2969223 RepID=UPI0028FC2052|nr:acetyltransferase [Deinococcus sp. Marseille-Q6407]
MRSARGWLDNNPERHGQKIKGLPVLGDISWLANHPGVAVHVAIGSPAVRYRVVRQIEALGPREFATLIHPGAHIGRHVRIGAGSIVCAGASITTDVQTGRHNLINNQAAVAHDVMLGDFVTVAPNATLSGNVQVGDGVDFGTGAIAIQGLQIGEWSIVGAGAVLISDLPGNCTAVGVPVRPIKYREAGWHE